MKLRLAWCVIGCVLVAVVEAPAIAQPVADFYKGKQVTLYVGYEAGGGYDLYARILAKYLPRHIPGNPSVIAINMPGASSMVLGNHLAKVAPKDGTALGAVNSALVFDPIFSGAQSKAQFKGPEMTMVGNIVSSASVLISWKTSGVKTLDDLKAKKLIIAATSRSGDTYFLPLSLKTILHLDNLQIVLGYPGTREVALALERGEVNGRVWDMEGIKAARPDWLTDGSINIVAQLAPKKMPEVPATVPLAKDYVTDDGDKKVLDVIFMSTILARPYIAPPGLRDDRVKALRDGFMETMNDQDFIADTTKSQLTVSPTSGAEMQSIVEGTYALPGEILNKVHSTLVE